MGERCRVKNGWLRAGREGLYFATIADEPLGQPWAVVLWDGEEDPDCFKAAGLEVVREEWQPLTTDERGMRE